MRCHLGNENIKYVNKPPKNNAALMINTITQAPN